MEEYDFNTQKILIMIRIENNTYSVSYLNLTIKCQSEIKCLTGLTL